MSLTTRRPGSDRGLTLLVIMLLSFIFVLHPLAEIGVIPLFAADFVAALSVLVGVGAVARQGPLKLFFLAVALVTLMLHGLSAMHPDVAIRTAYSSAAMLSTALLATLLIADILGGGPMNIHRVVGCVAVYLLIALIFAQAYRIIALQVPDPFAINGTPVDGAAIASRLSYFSFSTLTTVGYGDVTPLHPFARSLATLEAVIGQLFPAIFIARLVTLELAERRSG